MIKIFKMIGHPIKLEIMKLKKSIRMLKVYKKSRIYQISRK
jgi:hypothetical protein